MNTKELIEKIEALTAYSARTRPWIDKEMVLEIVKQLDEPQKVLIPQFVADWITYCKDMGYTLKYAIYFPKEAENEEVNEWVNKSLNNQEAFALAWINGYEVEKEKKYLVKMKNLRALFCYLGYIPDEGYWTLMASGGESIIIKHTHKELEEAGFGEVFNSPLFEVEEVEE